ncbi:hypothetical protein [Heyndrickxia acidicola]|uniref:Group-specific protein n=1 Tax=Heyndrickxia acidicola TaxID=209389 RepID=A0ABU6MHS5_9BACI|nr:hypothetical protein [Heyndrickxia acidicola]MED1204065.1 hypothetical protein [Heyndrickxia acidicola]
MEAQNSPSYQKRVKSLYAIGIFFFLLLGARMAYMEVIYHIGKTTLTGMKDEVEVLNSTLIDDVQNRFNVDLEGYQEFTYNELAETVTDDYSEMSIMAIANQQCQKGCTGTPSAFIRENKGYVFYRQKNGLNVLLRIKEKKNQWEVSSKETKE